MNHKNIDSTRKYDVGPYLSSEKFHDRIREYRDYLGLTIVDISKVAGIHHGTYYYSFERGLHNITYKNMIKILDALELDPTAFLRDQLFLTTKKKYNKISLLYKKKELLKELEQVENELKKY